MNLSEERRGADSVCGVVEIRVLWSGTKASVCPEKWNDRKRVQMQTGRETGHTTCRCVQRDSMRLTSHLSGTSTQEDTTAATQRGQVAQTSFGGGSGGRSDVRLTRSETECTNSVISTEIETGMTWAGMIEAGKHSEKEGCP